MPRRRQPPAEPEPPARRGWQAGSVTFDPARQQWRARTPRDAEGKRRSAYHPTRAEAERWLADWQAARTRASAPFDPARPLGEYLRSWYRLQVPRWKPLTRRKVAAQITSCQAIMQHPLDGLTATHLDELVGALDARGVSAAYIRDIVKLLERALAWAVRRKILTENVALDVEPPRAGRRTPRAWSLDEIARFTAACRNHRFEAAFLVLLHAGLRIGEVLALRWDAIDAEAGVVDVRDAEWTHEQRQIGTAKYESAGPVDVAPAVAARLGELKATATTPYVVGKPAGERTGRHGQDRTRWSATTLRQDWHRLCAEAKVTPLPPHAGGRHSFATAHMRAGTDLADIAGLLRHASPATTAKVYLSGDRTRRRQAADRLGTLLAKAPAPNGTQNGTQCEG